MSEDVCVKKEKFNFDLPELLVRKTVLNDTHKALGAKMVPFAGWEMPVQYEAGIFAEHKAVRTAAGMFDVSHMGVFEVKGSDAEAFLNTVLTNNTASLKPGKAQYNYILKPDGRGLDDSFLYRFSEDKFMLVVNAANAEKDWAWLEAVKSGEYIIDNDDPSRSFTGNVSLRNLRDAGEESLIDLAFQGPLSRDVLLGLADSAEDKEKIAAVKMNSIAEVNVAGIKIILTGTGYTGENTGFEIYVHPDSAVKLWHEILAAGKDKGVLPIGLGARDSLRIEAGFPLFGHELEGDDKISITEAGYGFAVKAEVDFFVGKAPYLAENEPRKRKILRLHGKGSRSLREGHIIIDGDGNKIAAVTSFAFLDKDKNFIIMALADFSTKIEVGEQVKGYRAAEVDRDKGIDERKIVDLTLLDRFCSKEEKSGWQDMYSK